MIANTYSDMMPDISMRSMLKNPEFTEDLGVLMREQRPVSDREKEMSPYRSGSAPPTVEGSLNAFGGLFDAAAVSNLQKIGQKGSLVSEEELRADPEYVNYYYSKVNMNPRLPPPLVSKEDWRFSQRLGGIGDRRKVGRSGEEGVNGNGSVDGNGIEVRKSVGEWGGDGLIGLPGLGLGSRQKSIAEMIQDDINNVTSVSRLPSRPASCNAFDGLSAVQNIGASASHSYASALGASLSRSTTPDPQVVARAPSPRIPPVGVGRTSSMDKRGVGGPNSYNGVSPGLGESADLVAALTGLNLSTNGMVDEENHSGSQVHHEHDDHHNLFNLQGNLNHAKQNSYYIKELHKPVPSNSYLKGPSTLTLNGGANSPSRYQNLDNMNSSFPNYGLSGYGINPASPSMMGSQLGNGNLPPLYDNVAAASAMGVTSMDSMALGGSLAFGPNLMAAAAELQNLSRTGSHATGTLQMPLIDPLFLQYLRSNEYAAAQVAALSEPTLDREHMANSYTDILGLQKAYLGALLSPQKSQYGVPYLGKSGSLNHGYYGNPGFGLGMSYPGSPLGAPLLPNSPVGSSSPVRHGERNMRFSSGVRNLAGGIVGAWHTEASGNLDESFASSLLDEFKSNKTRSFELSEIAGHVVEFSADQYGSRFIQQKLETATTAEKDMVFNEIMPQALSLMTDVFGNYVIQKFFEHGSASQIRQLADQLNGHVLTLSLQMYGCRVIQKAIEVVQLDQQTKMVKELDGHIMRCVRDQNGNHVIQKCIECVPEDAIQFIVTTFYDQVVTLSTHPYGCRVIQRVLEHCHDPMTQHIMMDEVLRSICMLAQDQYGNYVVQHVLEHGKPHERSSIIKKLTGQIVQMSQQKFASNVVEKCLSFGTPTEREILVNEMLGSTDENEPLQAMMKDQFANYVVQKVLETCDDQQLELILNRIKVHLNALKKYTYGKHIVARVEKLVAAGERRISIQAAHHV